MKFDFTSIIDRRGKDAIAVDVANYPDMASFAFGGITVPKDIDIIPMWVADMDFKCCDEIINDINLYIEDYVLNKCDSDLRIQDFFLLFALSK